jgi:two-component system sensor histidine kinase/response regulator
MEPGIVLLIQHDPDTSGKALDALNGTGFTLSVCEQGEGAIPEGIASRIAEAAQLQPALILLDAASEAAALDTCRQLQADPGTADIPILLLLPPTSAPDQLYPGAADVLIKPLFTQALQSRIRILMSLQALQQQVQHQNQRLQQETLNRQCAVQTLRDIMHAIAHDLRNPVLGMQMVFSNLLKGRTCTVSSDEDLVSVSRSELERMAKGVDCYLGLINAMLNAHAEPDEYLVIQPEPLRLDTLVQEVIQDLDPLLKKSRATVFCNIDPDLPPVKGDPKRLWEVLENLLVNALKHNPPGIQLTVELRQEEDSICFSVQDNGIGIPPEQCQRLFGLHQRGENARQGLGLGLYLCQRIIQAHGGKILVDSRPKAGAKFWFLLPLEKEPQPAAIAC